MVLLAFCLSCVFSSSPEKSMLLFFAFILVCASESFDRGFNANIAWTNSLEQGLERAKAENKKAFVLIHKTWCGACKRLKSSFSNAAIELASKVKEERDNRDERESFLFFFFRTLS